MVRWEVLGLVHLSVDEVVVARLCPVLLAILAVVAQLRLVGDDHLVPFTEAPEEPVVRPPDRELFAVLAREFHPPACRRRVSSNSRDVVIGPSEVERIVVEGIVDAHPTAAVHLDLVATRAQAHADLLWLVRELGDVAVLLHRLAHLLLAAAAREYQAEQQSHDDSHAGLLGSLSLRWTPATCGVSEDHVQQQAHDERRQPFVDELLLVGALPPHRSDKPPSHSQEQQRLPEEVEEHNHTCDRENMDQGVLVHGLPSVGKWIEEWYVEKAEDFSTCLLGDASSL